MECNTDNSNGGSGESNDHYKPATANLSTHTEQIDPKPQMLQFMTIVSTATGQTSTAQSQLLSSPTPGSWPTSQPPSDSPPQLFQPPSTPSQPQSLSQSQPPSQTVRSQPSSTAMSTHYKADLGKKNDELKQQMAKLRAELDAEKAKSKQQYRDKVAEIKQLKQQQLQEQEHLLSLSQAKQEQVFRNSVQQERDKLQREHEQLMQRLHQQHQEALKHQQLMANTEKEEAIKVAMEIQRRSQLDIRLSDSPIPSTPRSGNNSAIIIKLQREIMALKEDKRNLEVKLNCKSIQSNDLTGDLVKVRQKLNHRHGADNKENLFETSERFDERIVEGNDGEVILEKDDDEHSSLQQHDREKERQLQKKVTELNGQVIRLEKRVELLKNDNQVLKKKADELKPSEEKIKKLKKRNAELAAIARRLEEKAKNLQLESTKRQHAVTRQSPNQDVEQVKRAFAKQRAKDLTEFAKNTMEKDKEIEMLRQKCQQLSEKLTSRLENSQVENSEIYSNQDELECIIKHAAKDRLRMEHALCQAKQNESQDSELQHLRQENEETMKNLQRLQSSYHHLEQELHDMVAKNTDLSDRNTALHDRLLQLHEEMKDLQSQKLELEEKQTRTLSMLKDKQLEIDKLKQENADETRSNQELINDLESTVKELERRYELQAIQHEEITVEMEELRKEAEIAKFRPAMQNMDIQTDNTLYSPVVSVSTSSTTQHVSSPIIVNSPILVTASHMTTSPFTVATIHRSQDSSLVAEAGVNHVDVMQNVGLNKKPFQVYVAKYNYDPDQYSPNENPDAELTLSLGDYIFVYGGVDEDGFYEGETMDGIRGLVPSNFVEKVPEEDLEEFHATIGLSAQHDMHLSVDRGSEHNLDFDSSEEVDHADIMPDSDEVDQQSDMDAMETSLTEGDVDINVTITELDGSNHGIPCPCNLHLDRRLADSILISWSPPTAPCVNIVEYQVTLDGLLHMIVKATERCKALIEGVDNSECHRVSVRAVTVEGNSSDQQCTMIVRRDAPIKPEELSVTNVTTSSAVISWMPANSNINHSVTINQHGAATVSPGIYRCLLSGLKPGWRQKVTVTAGPTHSIDRSISSSLTFHTLDAVTGIPDAPIDVQVEAGPRHGSLLVTWIPVTITTTGMSNGAYVSGYNLFCDGQKVQYLNNPTGDHMVQDIDDRFSRNCSMTIRTQALEQESADSQPVILTSALLDEISPPERAQAIKVNSPVDEFQRAHNQIPAHMSPTRDSYSQAPLNSLPHHRAASPHHRPASPHHRPASPLNMKPSHTTVPDIQITKDSSCSFSDSDNISEDEQSLPRAMNGSEADLHHKTANRPLKQGSPKHYSDNNDRVPSNQQEFGYEYRGAIYDIDEYSHNSTSRKSNSQVVQERNERNVSESSRYHQKPGAYSDNNNIHHQQQQTKQSKSHDRSNTNQTPPSFHNKEQKKRDYFEAKRTPNHDNSYSQLEDNNVLTSKVIRDDIPLSDLIDYEDDEGESLVESVELEYDENRVRIFIALFDYDPATMSPNPDAMDEELYFKEGQLIKIYGEKDPDGFFVGESQGRRGFVPCNMVSEVEVDDPDVADQLLKESGRAMSHTSKSSSRGTTPSRRLSAHEHRPRTADRGSRATSSVQNSPLPEGPIRYMVALYPYDPHALSPNVDSELELAFSAGDKITVYGDMDEDGFYYGELKGRRGLVPSNFLEEIQPEIEGDPRSGTFPSDKKVIRTSNNHTASTLQSGQERHSHSGQEHNTKVRGEKAVDFVQASTKPARPDPPSQPSSTTSPAHTAQPLEKRDSKPAAPTRPESPPSSPHNILNLDINNVKERKKGFFSRGIFKKMSK